MLKFSQDNPYPSQRSLIYSCRGMVATSQPQAAAVGRDILAQGGNAVDAAIAMAAALTVVEPTGNGIGGDAFALVWMAADNNGQGKLHGLNASGPAPELLTREAVLDAGHKAIPSLGWMPVTVPGAPSAWIGLSKRFGKLDFADLLAPAIRLAREGFPVSPVIAGQWRSTEKFYRNHLPEKYRFHWFDTFTFEGHAPVAGEIFRNEAQALTFESLARTKCESFYHGDIAEKIDALSQADGGYLRISDLDAYMPEWVEPISTNYRGVDVWELPPNGQGLIALVALNIMSGFDDLGDRYDISTLHRQCEALKLAQTDGLHYIAHAHSMSTPVEAFMGSGFAAARRALIGDHAIDPAPGAPPSGGTVYLATADGEGNMVSFIQSNYRGFGSGIVVPGTGITLQNRGQAFSLEPARDNVLAPGKKPFHTIIPGFLSQNGKALGPFGVMGGMMQPQAHMQIIMNMLDFGLNPQAALDAPRWCWMGGRKIKFEHGFPGHLVREITVRRRWRWLYRSKYKIEHGFPSQLIQEMAARGHEVDIASDRSRFGRGQIILRDAYTGVLCGATESRADSAIEVY